MFGLNLKQTLNLILFYLFIPGKNQLVGDMLCLAGSLLFAIVTVLQEMMLKTHSCSNYLATLGLIGSIVSCTQTFFMEFNELKAFNWYEFETIVQLGSYCGVQTVFQILQCFMLRDAGSIVLHLSFLSADYYTLIAGMFIFQFKVRFLKNHYLFCCVSCDKLATSMFIVIS